VTIIKATIGVEVNSFSTVYDLRCETLFQIYQYTNNEVGSVSLSDMAAETGRKLLVALVIIAFVCCGLTQANKKGFIRKKFNSPNLVGKHEVQAEVQTTAVPSPSVPPPPSCSTDTICAQLNVIANVINILANQTAELHNGTHLPGEYSVKEFFFNDDAFHHNRSVATACTKKTFIDTACRRIPRGGYRRRLILTCSRPCAPTPESSQIPVIC
jgi:hypothetical protein